MNSDYLSIQPEWLQHTRLVDLEGTFNLRDLGGYPASDGLVTMPGKVFRSDDLHSLTSGDIRKLEKLNLRTVIDFRAGTEAKAAPDQLPKTVVNAVHLPIDPANVTTLKNAAHDIKPELMITIYRLLVTEFRETYRRFFEIIQNEAASPLLFHCSGGKDRTGIGAALFLSALGVEKGIIINDYLVSKERAELKYAREIEARPQLMPLLTVLPEYLDAAFDTIDQEYGGMEPFLTKQLDVDLALLRKLYTANSPLS